MRFWLTLFSIGALLFLGAPLCLLIRLDRGLLVVCTPLRLFLSVTALKSACT